MGAQKSCAEHLILRPWRLLWRVFHSSAIMPGCRSNCTCHKSLVITIILELMGVADGLVQDSQRMYPCLIHTSVLLQYSQRWVMSYAFEDPSLVSRTAILPQSSLLIQHKESPESHAKLLQTGLLSSESIVLKLLYFFSSPL